MVDSSLGGFAPFNDAHAIVEATINVVFDRLPDPVWRDAKKTVIRLGRELGLGVPQPSFGVTVLLEQSRVLVNAESPQMAEPSVGLVFTQLDENDNIAMRLSVLHNQIALKTTAYVRWTPLIALYERAFEFIKDRYLPFVRPTQVNLSYVDMFFAPVTTQSDYRKVLRAGSPWVLPNIITSDELWHCHSGQFSKVDEWSRRLTRANIDYADTLDIEGHSARSLVIRTTAQDSFNNNGYTPLGAGTKGSDFFIEKLHDQHAHLKTVLREILSDDATNRIGM